jgi:hypothetical protein
MTARGRSVMASAGRSEVADGASFVTAGSGAAEPMADAAEGLTDTGSDTAGLALLDGRALVDVRPIDTTASATTKRQSAAAAPASTNRRRLDESSPSARAAGGPV